MALRHRGDAFRAVYALLIHEDVWVLHAFQTEPKNGIKTPCSELDLVHQGIRRLRKQLG